MSKTKGQPIKRILHDDLNDPYQLRNIAAEKPDVVAALTEEMERSLRTNGDPWLQNHVDGVGGRVTADEFRRPGTAGRASLF